MIAPSQVLHREHSALLRRSHLEVAWGGPTATYHLNFAAKSLSEACVTTFPHLSPRSPNVPSYFLPSSLIRLILVTRCQALLSVFCEAGYAILVVAV